MARSISDAEIREVLRRDHSLLDTAMVALHSTDREFRRIARRYFLSLAAAYRPEVPDVR